MLLKGAQCTILPTTTLVGALEVFKDLLSVTAFSLNSCARRDQRFKRSIMAVKGSLSQVVKTISISRRCSSRDKVEVMRCFSRWAK